MLRRSLHAPDTFLKLSCQSHRKYAVLIRKTHETFFRKLFGNKLRDPPAGNIVGKVLEIIPPIDNRNRIIGTFVLINAYNILISFVGKERVGKVVFWKINDLHSIFPYYLTPHPAKSNAMALVFAQEKSIHQFVAGGGDGCADFCFVEFGFIVFDF